MRRSGWLLNEQPHAMWTSAGLERKCDCALWSFARDQTSPRSCAGSNNSGARSLVSKPLHPDLVDAPVITGTFRYGGHRVV